MLFVKCGVVIKLISQTAAALYGVEKGNWKMNKNTKIPLNFNVGSPEALFTRFCQGWKDQNARTMLDVSSMAWRLKRPKAKEKLEMWFSERFLMGMKIVKMTVIGEKQIRISAKISYRKYRKSEILYKTIRVISILEGLDWKVSPLSVFMAMYDL